MERRSYAYASQQIREAIKQNQIIVPNFKEDRIQPSSFEPTIGNELFIVDVEYQGVFRISPGETVYENLYSLPARQRQRVDISNGFELKKGFSYLIPLEEEIALGENEHIRSSPKSSLGRLFINTRLISDYNPGFDEINYVYSASKRTKMWLYVQPLAFNVIVYPGLSLNQLRFFKGYEAQFSPNELVKELENNPILYLRNADGEDIPADRVLTDGLYLHLNLSGDTTDGVIGLRARHNPVPIDLSKKSEYDVEDFFEPIIKNGDFMIKRGEYYLLSSREILKIPDHISIELRAHSHLGFQGPLHFAGFFDNGFEGDIVYEVRSDELSKEMQLIHNMPVSKMDIFKTDVPDKIYGKSNNNYNFQIGPKPAKYFIPPDYKYLARKYTQLNVDVLAVDRQMFRRYRKSTSGFEPMTEKEFLKGIYKEFEYGVYQSRYLCESDDLILQVSPYVIIRLPENKIFVYKKSIDMEKYPEPRLFGKHSIGAYGGHILEHELPDFITNVIARETVDKGIKLLNHKGTKFIGTVQGDETLVDQSHFGLVYCVEADDVEVLEGNIEEWEIITIDKLADSEYDFESWSQMIIKDYFSTTK